MAESEEVRDVSLAANLQRLELLARGWVGVPLDPRGTVRLINPDADRTPIFWCFNGQQEFPALAAALGPGQPLAGMRSLNQVMAGGPLRHVPDRELADTYAQTLLRHFGPVRCIIGGNCQAASVAHHLALHWMRAGGTVERLVTLDATLRRPYPGALRLLFGERSPKHNPFLTQADPDIPWRFTFAAHDYSFLPAGHGEYFGPGVVDRLAEAILAPSRSGPERKAPAAALDLHWAVAAPSNIAPSNIAVGGTIALVASAPANLEPDQHLALLPLWSSPEHGSWLADQGEYLAPIQHLPVLGGYHCAIRAPDLPGQWTLDPVTCSDRWGPWTTPVQPRSGLEFQIG